MSRFCQEHGHTLTWLLSKQKLGLKIKNKKNSFWTLSQCSLMWTLLLHFSNVRDVQWGEKERKKKNSPALLLLCTAHLWLYKRMLLRAVWCGRRWRAPSTCYRKSSYPFETVTFFLSCSLKSKPIKNMHFCSSFIYTSCLSRNVKRQQFGKC